VFSSTTRKIAAMLYDDDLKCHAKLASKVKGTIMAVDPQSILVVTTENVPGYRVTKVIGEVFGVTSRSRNVVSNFGAGLKTLVGGEIQAFTNLLHETRTEAMGRLRQEAAARGANAVVMMRFDNESIAQTAGGTIAYGTAVVLEPEN
jgi:uncharacterized protein YbjQ (UPF0145 family)